MVDEGGNARRIEAGAGAGFRLAVDPSGARVAVSSAASARVLWSAALGNLPAHPYCCGFDQEEWATASCGLTAVVHGAWADATAAILVLETGAYDGPDGCEQGPDFRVVALPR